MVMCIRKIKNWKFHASVLFECPIKTQILYNSRFRFKSRFNYIHVKLLIFP